MKIEGLPSSSLYTDDDQKNLKQLLDAFGSSVSLDDIAVAYCQAGRDVDDTTEILCKKQDSAAGISMLESQDALENGAGVLSVCLENHLGEVHMPKLKQKNRPVSMGTVSGLIGREYANPKPQHNGLRETFKPVKLNSSEIPVTEIWDEKKESGSTSRNESMTNDVEELLYKMLGNGFQLEMSVIHDVVGQCGYDLSLSIDKLLDLSVKQLKNIDDVIGIASEYAMENSQESMSFRKQSPPIDFCGRSSASDSSDELIVPQTEKNKNKNKNKRDIERDILESLFNVPERIEKKPESTHLIRPTRQQYGRVVAKPLEEIIVDDFTFITREPVHNRNDEENNNGYEDLRKAAMEYWVLMKEYYKAAVDAYTEKDYEKFQKLHEQGIFYMKKAREADEKSSQKLIQDSDDEEELSVNLHHLDPRDALVHLKLQLTSFSGISSIPNLKVVVGTEEGNGKDRKRKRLITKLLENEEIPWTEKGNGWTISIRVDNIDPEKLSFSKK